MPLFRLRKRNHRIGFGCLQTVFLRLSLCHDVDVQTLTFEAYMNKKLVSARPLAHLKIMFKNLAHLTGIVSKEFT